MPEIEELRAFKSKHQWQPIDTAPRDITILLLSDEGVFQGGWDLKAWYPLCLVYHGCGCCGGERPMPTHWQPLPEPPQEKGKDDA